jgi:hypothetical protein
LISRLSAGAAVISSSSPLVCALPAFETIEVTAPVPAGLGIEVVSW